MSQDTGKTLWGFPIVISDAVTPGTAILGPIPTWDDVLRYGSLEKAIAARAKEYGAITGLDDSILEANEISE